VSESALIPGFGTVVNDLQDQGHWLAVLRFLKPYEAKDRQYSVTTLTSPTQVVELKRTRWQDVIVQASDVFYRLLGTSYHLIFQGLERDAIQQEVPLKVERVVDGKPAWVSGRLDEVEVTPEGCIIRDRKMMACYEATKGLSDDKVAQLNLYAHLYEEMTGRMVVALQIVGLLRDWSKTQTGKEWAVMKKGRKRAILLFQTADEAGAWMEAQSDSASMFIERRESTYPSSQEVVIDVPLWPPTDREAFMIKRLRAHLSDPVPCTPEETWGGRRCKNYCDVAGVCPQYQEDKR